MKVSEHWLRDWVDPELNAQGMADQLTMAGLEVDSLAKAAADFSGVVIARIDSIAPHPDADKLRVCHVNDGTDLHQVVCGAPNAAQGLVVPLARIGAVLPGNFKIKQAKLRGVASHGMLCGASELGLEEEHSAGLMALPADAPLGVDIREWLSLDDTIIDIDLTPNRGDCLSIRGIAREIGALNRVPVTALASHASFDEGIAAWPFVLCDDAACPKLLTCVVQGVDAGADTPLWMAERLRRAGVRRMGIIRDVAHYVMLELGQPLHAYDASAVKGALTVRWSQQGERLVLLDGQAITLDDETLVIADDQGVQAVAGVMGGQASGVTAATENVVLEAAFFSPLAIAGRARRYGLHTEASHRFERGVDPALQQQALTRAVELLMRIAGGQAGRIGVHVADDKLPTAATLFFPQGLDTQRLGITLPKADIAAIFERLGMQVQDEGDGWRVAAPSWRFDIEQPADLIEELARIHGYNAIPSQAPRSRLAPVALRESALTRRHLHSVMQAAGFHEAITYSFVAPELQRLLQPKLTSPTLANPLSADLAVMRTSLWPGLCKALTYNLNRQQTRVALFETGQVFHGDDIARVSQVDYIGAVLCGSRFPSDWNQGRERADFFDLKGVVERLMAQGRRMSQWRFVPDIHPALHPGQSARIEYLQDSDAPRTVGWIGAIHPEAAAQLEVPGDVYLFEMEMAPLLAGRLPWGETLSRFPEVRRDLAFVVKDDVPVFDLITQLRAQSGEWLNDVHLFDVYAGNGVAPEHKSLALTLSWQHPERTLTDEEIDAWVFQAVDAVSSRYGATLRS